MLGTERLDQTPAGNPQATTAAMRRTSTRAFYDVNCEAYSSATLSLDTSAAIARFASFVAPSGDVLDAGCGSGRDLLLLRDAGLRPVGLDISAKLVEIAKRNSGLLVVEGDLRTPPFLPRSFDGIWAMASLLHLEPLEIRPTLGALGSLLRPDGILFTSVKHGSGRVRDGGGRWFTLHDEASWRGHLEASGFEVIGIDWEPSPVEASGAVSTGWVSSLARLL